MAATPTVLALDMSSSGVTAGRFHPDLTPIQVDSAPWEFVPDTQGVPTLSAARLWEQTASVIRESVAESEPPAAIALSSMMHTLLVTDPAGVPRSPVYTWMDLRSSISVQEAERLLGKNYTARTGAYPHPSFPAFKLALMGHDTPEILAGPCRIASAKAYVAAQLTRVWAEDIATASASGLLNLAAGSWDEPTLEGLGVPRARLGSLVEPTAVIGGLQAEPAARLQLPEGLPVVAGAGDGFLATLGSGCEALDGTAVTLGTSPAVRRFSPSPRIDPARGTFCYRYSADSFLVGAAGNNGGNVLDWADRQFRLDNRAQSLETAQEKDPLFLPFLNGERSPFWDPTKKPCWIHAGGHLTAGALRRSVIEAVAFQLGIYFELVNPSPANDSAVALLSGNAFRREGLAALVAAVIPVSILEPDASGFATLRGAARCGFHALGVSTAEATAALVAGARRISANPEPLVQERYSRFKTAYFAAL